jgi:hypothetical protein
MDLGAKAEGKYTYTVDYYANEKDAIIDYSGDGWPKTPNDTGKGNLEVTSIDEHKKLRITLDNGLTFTTSELESDALINPTGSFSFTIPTQTVADNTVITGINIGKSPDGDLWQGNFALSTDFSSGENNYELSFGIKYVDSNKMAMRFTALSKPVELE